MQKSLYDKIIGFLLGASWAIVLSGALITFKTFAILGFALATILTILYIFISLFLVLSLDAFSVNRARLEESKKQTALLEELVQKKQLEDSVEEDSKVQ